MASQLLELERQGKSVKQGAGRRHPSNADLVDSKLTVSPKRSQLPWPAMARNTSSMVQEIGGVSIAVLFDGFSQILDMKIIHQVRPDAPGS